MERDQIEANHMDMCKFNDPEDIGYKRTAGFIIGFVGKTVEDKLNGKP